MTAAYLLMFVVVTCLGVLGIFWTRKKPGDGK